MVSKDLESKIRELVNNAENELTDQFDKAEEICQYNSEKVLEAFQKYRVTEADFGSTTVYGDGDIGR